ncbi:hypothetical protein N7E81_11905 [Reichenbachiella carrageenanivorans]|uniref:Uncharacterized protein n=1 Tax=Reichenbachiella carrageenanivorans TaxID=2979869 RepID=A0ABY6CVX5_9BACT|nr:hypothetical protein [Reichenbachiella carrageenanivorans]UXX78062.1 hypothetical protein N7E81_11905 [Reichenbachiella carrageenanivorans]
MNKFKNALMMAAFILPVLFIATSCGDDDDDSKWTQEQVDEAVSDCVEEGTDKEDCECFIGKVSREYEYDAFQDDDFDLGDLAKLLEFADACGISLQ